MLYRRFTREWTEIYVNIGKFIHEMYPNRKRLYDYTEQLHVDMTRRNFGNKASPPHFVYIRHAMLETISFLLYVFLKLSCLPLIVIFVCCGNKDICMHNCNTCNLIRSCHALKQKFYSVFIFNGTLTSRRRLPALGMMLSTIALLLTNLLCTHLPWWNFWKGGWDIVNEFGLRSFQKEKCYIRLREASPTVGR